MRSFVCWCCLLVLAPEVLTAAAQDTVVRSDQEILVELQQRWNEAFYRKDVDFIESILADAYRATYDDGKKRDKANELALVKEFSQHACRPFRTSSAFACTETRPSSENWDEVAG